jgi:meso-butanediol dehydrogenase / (S,S)-butanediol dehydrogenase / diacetyl reductase
MNNIFDCLANKTVLITGGCSGIGLATAVAYHKHHANVYIMDNSLKNITHIKKKFSKKFKLFHTDVRDFKNVQNTLKTIINETNIDILIANAGISVRNKFLSISPSQWQNVLQTNLTGSFYCAQLVAKHMHKRKRGCILFTSSTNGISAHPYYADYNASKAAIISLAKTMAAELAPFVRVNTIAPGYVLTNMQRKEYSPAMLKAVNKQLPLKRHAKPEEIANLFVYLSTQAACYITGQTIAIDGGETI